jgi:1,4-dihydroxy-6-naphthoate synthase
MIGFMHLRIGYSADPDDAFMWWPLFGDGGRGPRIDTGRFTFEPALDDIQALNERAERGELEITAMSCAQYPFVCDRYALTACGASMGEGYGPKLVATRPMSLEALRGASIAVPGERTSAFAALCLMLGRRSFQPMFVAFDQIVERITAGDCDAGVVIHEGQLTFGDAGLHLIADLGAWWSEREGLPLPLGVNAVQRNLGSAAIAEISGILLRSVEYALAHREESIAHALKHARGMEAGLADRYVAMYVNRWTLDFGAQGREAVRRFLAQCADAGLTPRVDEVEVVGSRL